jgi:mannose-6-phosphate isomerase-like protein (cupin superfamily)
MRYKSNKQTHIPPKEDGMQAERARSETRTPEALPARSVAAGGGDAYWFTNNRMTIKVRAADTDGGLGVVEGLGPAGSSPPLHVHHREHELFLLLEGSLTVRCGDETYRAEPGSVTFLPRGVPHTFVVEGEQPARLLSVCVPGGFEEYFAAAGRPAENEGLPPNEPPDVALLQRVGADFGVEIVGPPLAPAGDGGPIA